MGNIYTQLSLEERTMIHTQLERGLKPAAIAMGLNRSASTLSRELHRNGWTRPTTRRGPGRPPVAGGYRADAAHTRAQACTVTPRVARRLRPGTALWNQVTRYLKAGYSPEQIAGTLARVHADRPSLQVSHETIYTALYAMPRGALRTDMIGWLRFGHAKRRPRARGEDRRGRIPDMVSIHDRPPEVEERLIPGHWEGDLIKGAQNRSAVGTLVERTTLFTVLSRMDNARAEAALSGFSHVLNRIEAQWRRSLTDDQGREMAAHQRLTEATGVKVYVADAAQSLAARHQREHQRPVAAVPAQGKRLEWLHPGRAGCDCLETEYPTTQVAGFSVSRGAVHPGRVRFQAASCGAFCTWSLKPPCYKSAKQIEFFRINRISRNHLSHCLQR